jgi:hypothetical protein
MLGMRVKCRTRLLETHTVIQMVGAGRRS